MTRMIFVIGMSVTCVILAWYFDPSIGSNSDTPSEGEPSLSYVQDVEPLPESERISPSRSSTMGDESASLTASDNPHSTDSTHAMAPEENASSGSDSSPYHEGQHSRSRLEDLERKYAAGRVQKNEIYSSSATLATEQALQRLKEEHGTVTITDEVTEAQRIALRKRAEELALRAEALKQN